MFDPSALRACASTLPEVQLLVLFGSAARGQLRPDSDIDVGVLLTDSAADSAAARMRVEGQLSVTCVRPLDFVVINHAPPQLRFEIAKGEVLFERRPGAWRDMKAVAMIDWWDWQPTARAVHQVYLGQLRARAEATRGP